MNESDINRILPDDANLRQAVNRREQKLPPMPADLNDRLMQRLVQEEKPVRRSRLWLYIAAASVAAGVLLLLTLHYNVEQQALPMTEPPTAELQQPVAPPSEEPSTTNVAVIDDIQPATPSNAAVDGHRQMAAKTATPRPRARRQTREIPDTLGQAIWHREENVVRAVQMLADCEATIEREEQAVRNAVVEATFHATPHPANAVLLTNDNGDCFVSDIDTQTIIEI